MIKRLTTSEFIKKAKKIHGDKYNYLNVSYKTTHKRIPIVCKLHGTFYQTPNHHLNGSGCPLCGLITVNVKLRQPQKIFIEKSNKIHKNKYDYSKVNYVNAHTKVTIVCLKHGSFFQRPLHHLVGVGCPKCSCVISKGEVKFLNYINIPDTINNRHKLMFGFNVDGVKNTKIYEFLGDFWHGNPKIYDRNDINKANKSSFGELYDETVEKFSRLNGLGYSIYYMWENDWNFWNKNKSSIFPIKKYNGDNKI
jgi:Zn finger protein HypA/HybF involved in hydrogenase expression